MTDVNDLIAKILNLNKILNLVILVNYFVANFKQT